MFRKSITLTVMVLYMSIPLHAMYPLTPDDAFEQYIENGNPWGDEEMPAAPSEIIEQTIIQGIQKQSLKNNVIDDRSTAEYAKTLPTLPSTEIEARFTKYIKCFDEFMGALVMQQLILKQIKQEGDAGTRNTLLQCFGLAEQRTIAVCQWLTAIRDSGEEHYIGVSKLKPNAYPEDTETRIPSLFWISILRPKILSGHLRVCYRFHHPSDPSPYLNPTSMAILRHQLNKGFEGLDYKKTTEYTGQPICRLKFKGEEPRDWPYADFRDKLLELEFAALDLDTELLWQ